MTTIEDKIRKLDYEDKAPDIKPTLKNTLYDFHPDNTKKFKLEHTKEFDRDFKDGKATSFKEDSNIKMFGDSKCTHFKASKAKDPFENLFGYKHTERPNRFLDGYYEFKMKGKDNTFYMKDNLLREQGVITDLEARLQAKEEFMEQYHVRQEGAKRIPIETERVFNEEEALRADNADEGKEPEAIQVEKARRRQQTEEDVTADIEAEVEDLLQALKEQTELPDNNIKAINKRFDDFLIPEKRTPATRKGMNTLLKELKKGLPINVKQITMRMTEDDITKTINDAKEKFNTIMENRAVEMIQKHSRRYNQKSTILKKAEDKLKEIDTQRSQMYAKTRADADKVKAIISQNKPKIPEKLAREQEARARQLAVGGGLTSTRPRRLSATDQTIPGPPPQLPTAPIAGAQAEPTPAVTADDAV